MHEHFKFAYPVWNSQHQNPEFLAMIAVSSRRMPIVLETFTNSNEKIIDL